MARQAGEWIHGSSLSLMQSLRSYHLQNDTLMWLLEEVVARGYSDHLVTEFLLATEIAAVQGTSAVSLSPRLYKFVTD